MIGATKMCLVSVIVPTYNRAHILSRTLESIIEQTYDAIEIIVIDDGSTDATEGLVESLARHSNRPLIYHKQVNAGCASARNTGMALSTGDMIAFLDSDDSWLSTATDSMATAILNSGADFVYTPAIEVHKDGMEQLNYPVAAGHPELLAIEHFQSTNLRNGAFMFHRRILERVQGLDENLRHNEDSDFVQRLAVTSRGVYSAQPTVRVYHHADNKSNDRPAIMRALLTSAENTLEDYPIFRDELGELASDRIRKLRLEYVQSLVRAGDFALASSVKTTLKVEPTLSIRMALWTRSAAPVKIASRVERMRQWQR